MQRSINNKTAHVKLTGNENKSKIICCLTHTVTLLKGGKLPYQIRYELRSCTPFKKVEQLTVFATFIPIHIQRCAPYPGANATGKAAQIIIT
jgi:hypothetical protein